MLPLVPVKMCTYSTVRDMLHTTLNSRYDDRVKAVGYDFLFIDNYTQYIL